MPCYRPLQGYRKPGGGISFARGREAFSDLPVTVQCGQCIGCRRRRTTDWATRIVHEARSHERSCFITLTYNDEHLPADGSLRVEDWQKFAKRLRKRVGPFRYFHAGEYGSKTQRPHYHAAIFGHDFSADREQIRSGSTPLYRSGVLDEVWAKGFCSVGALEPASARYVAKYVVKRATGDQAEKKYSRCDPVTGEVWSVRPEYATMSRGGSMRGLGFAYYQKYCEEIDRDGVCRTLDGKSAPIPRYYDFLLEQRDPEAFKKRQRERVRELQADPDQEWERQIVCEEVAEVRSRLYGTKL